jgi:hypothetical protein
MPSILPTLSKTWQFSLNNLAAAGVSLLTANQNLVFAIKEALKSFGTLPWTCWGSSDGVGACGNGDSNDRWAAATNCVWATAGTNHSWIVLTQTGLDAGGHGAICIDLNVAAATAASNSVILSPSVGFGAAHGGADGTATARPTATDEVVLLSAAAYGGGPSLQQNRCNVLQSTDGECTVVALCRNGGPSGLWIFAKANNPQSEWTKPVFGWVKGDATSNPTNPVTYANLTGSTGKTYLAAACSMNFTGEGDGTNMIGQSMTFADEDSGNWPMCGLGIYISTAGHRGRKGDVFDLWWGSTSRTTGDGYPAAGTTLQFLQFGNLILPWDSATALIKT